MSTAPIALVGAGEYLPVMTEIERSLIDGRAPRYVQLATAAAPEGEESLARWHKLGRLQAERLGVEQVVVDVRTRDDADRDDLAALVEGAGLVYLSGGNPAYLADTLRGTKVWDAIVAAHDAGAAIAGCSAGAMALSSWAPRMRDLVHPDQPSGLGLVQNLRVIPHFDKMLGWVPDVLRNALLHKPEGTMLVGIDEDTALVGGPHEWTVQGRQSVWELGEGKRVEHRAGTTLVSP
ncbi:MAG TPA: Type 1 glutamine amidotransferase-like domain-containing protein [Candidatus Nanopelagicales bacterium]|nr:Type 1 glutamine amidotransferase-like domain-containing protein [Candidatus Nanopelagicales bacterium]